MTGPEIDQEIDNVAIGRRHRPRSLVAHARQGARDQPGPVRPRHHLPGPALRKLAAPRVQVTENDMQDSFEAQYGEKLRVRIIMVDKLEHGPGDLGRGPEEPRWLREAGAGAVDGHRQPLARRPARRADQPARLSPDVADAAFHQLVDGDPNDKDPNHKPKDGDFTGPIQVAEATWVIIRREGIIPAAARDPKDENVRKGSTT